MNKFVFGRCHTTTLMHVSSYIFNDNDVLLLFAPNAPGEPSNKECSFVLANSFSVAIVYQRPCNTVNSQQIDIERSFVLGRYQLDIVVEHKTIQHLFRIAVNQI